jgi:hypothetical protein
MQSQRQWPEEWRKGPCFICKLMNNMGSVLLRRTSQYQYGTLFFFFGVGKQKIALVEERKYAVDIDDYIQVALYAEMSATKRYVFE